LLHWQKFTGNNRGDQKVNFGLQNALNLTYAHLQFKNFPGVIPRTPVKREREGRREKEGKGGKGKEIEGEGRGRGG
jgi:hypothetical protein